MQLAMPKLFIFLLLPHVLVAMDVPIIAGPKNSKEHQPCAQSSEKPQEIKEARDFFNAHFPDYYAREGKHDPYSANDLAINYSDWPSIGRYYNRIVAPDVIASLDKNTGKLSLWQIDSGVHIADLQASPQRPYRLSYHKKHAAVLAALYKKEVSLWQVDTEEMLGISELKSDGTALLCVDQRAVVGADNGMITIIGSNGEQFEVEKLHEQTINDIQHFRNSEVVIASQDGKATVYDIAKRQALLKVQPDLNIPITALCCKEDGTLLMGLNPKKGEPIIGLYDLNKQECLKEEKVKLSRGNGQSFSGSIRQIVPLENGYYAINRNNSAVYIWHPVLNSCLRYFAGIQAPIVISPDKGVYVKTIRQGLHYKALDTLIETFDGWMKLKCTHYPDIKSERGDDFFVGFKNFAEQELARRKITRLYSEDSSWWDSPQHTYRKIGSERIMEIMNQAAQKAND